MVLDVRSITSIADFFVLGTCESQRQVRSSAEYVDERLSREGIPSPRMEGLSNLQWVLLDYTDVIAHVFDRESREYYGLERLWGDAPRVAFDVEEKALPRRRRT